MRLLGLQGSKKRSGVERARGAKRPERVHRRLMHAGEASGDLCRGLEPGRRHSRRLDHVQAYRVALAYLHIVASEHADGLVDAARLQLLHRRHVGVDRYGHCVFPSRIRPG